MTNTKEPIDTVLLDYGKVLASPVTGNWYITPKTRKILGTVGFIKLLLSTKRRAAFRIGLADLNKKHLLHTEAEEITQFTEFYSLVLSMVRISDKTGRLAKALAEDITLNDGKVFFYKDVIPCITKLKMNYKVSILSDTWPSLRRVLEHANVLPLLDGLVMSCDYNACKTGTKLFEIAISKLGLTPQKTVFVDDATGNLDNALKVGLIPVLMDRTGMVHKSKYPIIHSLEDLNRFLDNL